MQKSIPTKVSLIENKKVTSQNLEGIIINQQKDNTSLIKGDEKSRNSQAKMIGL